MSKTTEANAQALTDRLHADGLTLTVEHFPRLGYCIMPDGYAARIGDPYARCISHSPRASALPYATAYGLGYRECEAWVSGLCVGVRLA